MKLGNPYKSMYAPIVASAVLGFLTMLIIGGYYSLIVFALVNIIGYSYIYYKKGK